MDVLKAGHHGSSTSSTQKFLNAVRPAVIVISAGEGNEYGHPHAGQMERFVKMTPHLYRTDMEGDVVVTADDTAYAVVTRKTHILRKRDRPGDGGCMTARLLVTVDAIDGEKASLLLRLPEGEQPLAVVPQSMLPEEVVAGDILSLSFHRETTMTGAARGNVQELHEKLLRR